jgi:LCP family protein required for cell wall assembly
MILSIDPETKQASMFSVMRDTYYKIPGYGFHKINEAEALGGPELVKQTVSNFLQLPIHYYVKTNFQGFANIVDVLGGIDMYVEKDMNWLDDGINDIHLQKGQQHLDGKHALMYVRFRHDALSDYTRTERQRNFIATLAKEMKSTNSIIRLPQILDSIQNDVETDMAVSDMLKLGNLAINLNISNMDSVQLPPVHDSTGTKEALLEATRDGGSVIIPDVYETRVLVHKTLNTGKAIVRTDDDQEPMVQNVAPPKQTPTPKVTTPDKQTPTPTVPNTDGKTTPTPGASSGTGSKTTPGGTNGPGTGNVTTPSTPGTTTPGTGNNGTGGSGSVGSGSKTGPVTPPANPGGATTPAAGTGTTGVVPSEKPST